MLFYKAREMLSNFIRLLRFARVGCELKSPLGAWRIVVSGGSHKRGSLEQTQCDNHKNNRIRGVLSRLGGTRQDGYLVHTSSTRLYA